ncbi:hypothetical protein LX69_01924 [Breznakibacter xylanolyticus]|uniref:Permuted papain-like amidase YaeF/Yiix C92 family enzyme n=1 Tax=Breznakibacter xylanolyticus TaxID=990 RepID=A0A2W7Q434_9BACT|nr:hypothetical protein [Breznakibacter xylanolyticus]PZX16429.1 hypothetical protein LX69_01924 [Breznakibacter xylanolyticus]
MLIEKQTTGYNSIKGDLMTGDLLLMHGIHMSSRCIETLEGCDWSHVGIVVKAGDIGLDVGDDDILFWESDSPTPVTDLILRKPKSGPMLVRLSERLMYNFSHGEDSKCAVRHLYTDRDDVFFQRFKALIPTIHSAVFPDTFHEFLNPTKGRIFHEKTSLDTMFCSELAAYTYMKLGLLCHIHPVNSYMPVDFSEKLSVGLLKRAWLGAEIPIAFIRP